jgi:hypothetical protein
MQKFHGPFPHSVRIYKINFFQLVHNQSQPIRVFSLEPIPKKHNFSLLQLTTASLAGFRVLGFLEASGDVLSINKPTHNTELDNDRCRSKRRNTEHAVSRNTYVAGNRQPPGSSVNGFEAPKTAKRWRTMRPDCSVCSCRCRGRDLINKRTLLSSRVIQSRHTLARQRSACSVLSNLPHPCLVAPLSACTTQKKAF